MKQRMAILFVSIIMILILLSIGSIESAADEENHICRGEEVVISVILLQNGTYGDPVPNQPIEFFDETNDFLIGTTYTDALGFGSITWGIPVDYQVGITTINATFRGNTSLFLAPTSASVLVHIMSSVEIHTDSVRLLCAPDDVVTIEAQLLDDEQTPVPNETLYVRSESQTIAEALTNSSGFAKFLIDCNTSWLLLGENSVQIEYDMNPSTHHQASEVPIIIEMQQIETSLTVNKSFTESVTLGSLIEYQVTLLSSEGPLANSTIQILLDGHLILETLTDHQGECSPVLLVDDTFDLGSHILVLKYAGSDRYSLYQTTDSFSVTSPVDIEVQIPDQVIAGETATINITATDVLGRAVTGLTFELNDTTLGTQIRGIIQVNSTQFIFLVPFSGPTGNHTILLVPSGNPYIETASFQIIASVWSRPRFALVSSSIQAYAWPGQEIMLEIQLEDFLGIMKQKEVIVSLDGMNQSSSATNDVGIVSLSFLAPSSEKQCMLTLFYVGNSTAYELDATYRYAFTVTETIPVDVYLEDYVVQYPLKQIAVNLRTHGLNGSTIGGLRVSFSWRSAVFEHTSSADGSINLHLSLPNRDGVFVLTYSVESLGTVHGMNGSLFITISEFDIVASEGLGIHVISLTLLLSIAVVVIPAVLRRIPID